MLFLPQPLPYARWVTVSSAELQELLNSCSCYLWLSRFAALGPAKTEPFGWGKDVFNCFEIFVWKEWTWLLISSFPSEHRQ